MIKFGNSFTSSFHLPKEEKKEKADEIMSSKKLLKTDREEKEINI